MLIKIVKYLLYRIVNNLFFKCKFFKKFITLLYTKKNYEFENIKILEFNFADNNTHLGDRLFTFPLIYLLIKNNYKIYFNKNDSISNLLFKQFYGVDIPFSDSDSNVDITVITKPSLLGLNLEFNNIIIIDFNDKDSTDRLPIQLIHSFRKIINFADINENIFNEIESNVFFNNPRYNYYIFNNYIDSGAFRKFFCNEKLLYAKCLSLRELGYKIIHVGSGKDLLNDKKTYNFIDIDLRGKIELEELLSIIKSKNVIGAVTFDNFIMHTMGFYKKKSFVLFRGRFKKSSREFHFNFVNNSFYLDESLLEYV